MGKHYNIGKDNGGYIDGRQKKKHYCIELGCNNEISYNCWKYGTKKCVSCGNKGKHNGSKNGMFGKHRSNRIKKIISKIHKGKKVSETTREKMSKNNMGRGNPHFGKPIKPKWGIYKGISMRSTWEIAFAYFLDLSDYKWKYESKTFDLGNTTYTPDFYLPKFDCYIEIKGYFSDFAKKKINLFRKLYPDINYNILQGKELKQMGVLK